MPIILPMNHTRSSGILLHPTSLPGPYGIGDIGDAAYRFADYLNQAGQRLWQVLPLSPTGLGDSPYQSFCCFAGNPLLISPDMLYRDGLLSQHDLDSHPSFPETTVDYTHVYTWKMKLLKKAYERFLRDPAPELKDHLDSFRDEHKYWLDDYTLFMALKERYKHKVWTTWSAELVQRNPQILSISRQNHIHSVQMYEFIQFLFFRQWNTLRDYCKTRDIALIGDIPIYAAHNSADVWAHPDVFQLDEHRNPIAVGGVPPDYFCETGQLWGNPLYDWGRLADTGYHWWVERFRATFKLCDIVRLDHFRGFEAYWRVPANEETAIHGEWVPGPREAFFDTMKFVFGDLPLIAENLGVITPEVEALREKYALPGMAVFQFGMGEDAASSSFAPHLFTQNLVAYTGTHDNDTIIGWWKEARKNPRKKAFLKKYIIASDRDFHWSCIRSLMASVANIVVFPLQDILGLDNDARMNRPGIGDGNWKWRATSDAFNPEDADKLRELTEIYGRI